MDTSKTVPKPGQRRHARTPAAVRAHIKAFTQVDLGTGCWLWLGTVDRDGYGRSNRLGTIGAHRVAYTAFIGPIPAGMTIDHKCRVRNCLNPAHLEPVTTRENLMRSPITLAAKNAKKVECPKGHSYNEENTYWHTSRGVLCRFCKTCDRDRHRARMAGAA